MYLSLIVAAPVLVLGSEPAPCASDHILQRAGNPQEISRLAHPSETPAYTGYHVGGGSPRQGDAPGPLEGTWGWDYEGICLRRKVILHWWHGRCQGGTGSYKTDGPHLRPLK